MTSGSKDRHTIGILVQNEPGVLSRIAGLFSGRGYNIENITASETHKPGITRITMVTTGDKKIMEQIVKQLNKLVNVLAVYDFREMDFVARELALIKVRAESAVRGEVLRIVDIFRAKVVDVSPGFYTLEVTGNDSKIGAIIELLQQIGIVEVARTGKVALARSRKSLQPVEE